MSFKAVNEHGMDKEIAARMASKYDKALEEKIQVWIETVTGATFDKPFGEMLQNGIVLCELVNALIPGKIKKINRAGGLFRFQENITNFIKVCRQIGVPEASLFPTESLAQLKDVNQVLTCINAFAGTVQRNKDKLGVKYNGPFLGPAPKNTGGNRTTKKWTVKPGGSAGQTLIGMGSSKTMEATKHVDAREQIKRNQLGGAGSGGTTLIGMGSSQTMEASKHVDAREQIKRNQLGGAGSAGATLIGQGSSKTMEETKFVDAREQIKRNQLGGAGTGGATLIGQGSSQVMEASKHTDVREDIKRGNY
eukprot:snap_masked-scaffold_25-processed-gene-5.14-mRNA-1 protein AED:0.67 eAED:0.67 QI:0/-1/0/1/-1/1/1/0/306